VSDIDFAKLKILVVDDEMFMRSLVRSHLNEMGVIGANIEFAINGIEAAKLLKKDENIFNLILLDLEMPAVDGFTLLDFVRNSKRPEIRNVPVIVLTGHTDQGSVVKAAQVGIQGYIGKPVSRKDLEKRISAVLLPTEIDISEL